MKDFESTMTLMTREESQPSCSHEPAPQESTLLQTECQSPNLTARSIQSAQSALDFVASEVESEPLLRSFGTAAKSSLEEEDGFSVIKEEPEDEYNDSDEDCDIYRERTCDSMDDDDDDMDDDDELPSDVDLLQIPGKCSEQAEQFMKYVWESGWRCMPHHALPDWLHDNDFLLKGHRPPLGSFRACFKSVFRIHTETGNIWTHLLGTIAFVGITCYFLTRPSLEIPLQEKLIFGTFFIGAIACLLFSTLFHTLYCHSPNVSKLFNKLDYCGISFLTMGSFVPWLYYSFYCDIAPKIAYLLLIGTLGTACIVVSLWDKFSTPQFRVVRAAMFIGLGLSGTIPAIHYCITNGAYKAFTYGAIGWLILMAVLYICGACMYAARIPERLFPGKCDIWFQSHQIFHIFVVAAAFVHYHGITELANYTLTLGDCITPDHEHLARFLL